MYKWIKFNSIKFTCNYQICVCIGLVSYFVSLYFQEISKNDSYCWVCHEGGEVLCCDKCPRVFHLQCSGLAKAPDDDEEWICPVCKVREQRV